MQAYSGCLGLITLDNKAICSIYDHMMNFKVDITWRFDIFWKHNGAIKSNFLMAEIRFLGF